MDEHSSGRTPGTTSVFGWSRDGESCPSGGEGVSETNGVPLVDGHSCGKGLVAFSGENATNPLF